MPRADVDGGGLDVGGRVGRQEDPQPVRQLDGAVRALFGEGFDEPIVGGQHLGVRGTRCRGRRRGLARHIPHDRDGGRSGGAVRRGDVPPSWTLEGSGERPDASDEKRQVAAYDG